MTPTEFQAGTAQGEHVVDRLVQRFDHHDPEMVPEVAGEVYDRLLEDPDRSLWTEAHGGFAVMTKHQDIRSVEVCPATYSSADGILHPAESQARHIPIDFDDPIHADYRKLFMHVLNKRHVKQSEGHIREKARELLTEFRAAGGGDVMAEVIGRQPFFVIMEIAGFSAKFREDAPPLFEAFLHSVGTKKGDEAIGRIYQLIEPELDLAEAPGYEGYLKFLVEARVEDGRALTREELTNALLVFIFAGFETTMGVMGSLTVRLAQDPELYSRLKADPSLIPAAVEETLRLSPTLQSQFRTVTEPVTLRGRDLTPGDKVMLLFAAANRDPEIFECPEEFNPERQNVKSHLAFGYGPHRCAGEHLARSQVVIYAETLIAELPPFHLAGDAKPAIRQGHLLGWESIPLSFEE